MIEPILWHAELSASSAGRWMHCPASIRASKDYPRRDTSYSSDGTLAHHYAARWLLTNKRPEMTGIDASMRQCVAQYVGEVKARAPGEIYVEESPAMFILEPTTPPTP